MTASRIKKTLIILAAVALALGIISFLVVFYPSGLGSSVAENIIPAPAATTGAPGVGTSTGTGFTIPTSSTSTGVIGGGAGGANASAGFQGEFSQPYPVNWTDDKEQFSVAGASLYENQLTLTLAITTGNVSECVPLNVRLVKDENGDLQTPNAAQFMFPDTGSCEGGTDETYSEPITFTIDPATPSPYLFTTGGAANIFFTIATTTSGGINVVPPPTSG